MVLLNGSCNKLHHGPYQTCKHMSHTKHCSGANLAESPERRMVGREDRHLFFVDQIPVKRTSKHQPTGTLETKSLKVGKKESIEMYLNNLPPGIILKWPEWWPKKV